MNSQDKLNHSLEVLLSKYISVWIWSIMFGLLSSLTFSYFRSDQFSRWGILALLPAMLMASGILSIIRAWHFLYLYLVRFLIPHFVHPGQRSSSDKTEEENEIQSQYPAQLLRRAFLMMIVAIALRLTMELTALLFAFLQF